MSRTPGLELARLIDRMGKDIGNAEGMIRDLMLMGASRMLQHIAKEEGIEGLTEMLLSNAIQGAGVHHNARIIRDHREGKEVGCGMCAACKAKQAAVSEEEVGSDLGSFLKALFGGNVTVVRVDLSELDKEKPTRH